MEEFPRPLPPRPVGERVRDWVAWFGVGRLVAASVATVIVCAGAVWLVRTPPPSTEASLPRASTTDVVVTGSTAPAATTNATPDVLLIHVAGAVVLPGVYELAPGARVRDAIVAAGGPTPDADWDALNLAAPVADGIKVYVPIVGEELPTALTVPPVSGPVPAGALVDVNAASATELEQLPGVGPATAAAIVAERERNGPFVGVDDLDRVPGIGPARLDALRELVTT